MSNFSENLIKQTISVFGEEDAQDLSPEQAAAILERLAGLFIAFKGDSLPLQPLRAEGVNQDRLDKYTNKSTKEID